MLDEKLSRDWETVDWLLLRLFGGKVRGIINKGFVTLLALLPHHVRNT